jgi:outer membrane biosynthesis protein TonB
MATKTKAGPKPKAAKKRTKNAPATEAAPAEAATTAVADHSEQQAEPTPEKAPEPQPPAKVKRGKAKAPKAAEPTGPMSGLDAAAKVLAEAGVPMNCKDLTDSILAQKLWFTDGKTPSATVYAAIIREIASKGPGSRFRKTDRGLFEFNGKGG